MKRYQNTTQNASPTPPSERALADANRRSYKAFCEARRKAREALNPPVPLDPAAVEAATQLDRIWFDRNRATRHTYARFELPGELPTRSGLPLGQRIVVFVTELEPGVRLRRSRRMLAYHAQKVMRVPEAALAEALS